MSCQRILIQLDIERSHQEEWWLWWRAVVSRSSRECGCMVEGELLTLSTVAWGLTVQGIAGY